MLATSKSLTVFYTLSLFWGGIFIFSAVNPYDWQNWFVEISPVVLAFAGLFLTRKKFVFSSLAYVFLFVWLFMHTIGAKYSFALVPLEIFDSARNHFDRVAHFAIGFWAIAVAEWLDHKKLIASIPLLVTFSILAIMGLAASYEIIEWQYAVWFGGQQAADFLGSQGDIWDAQKDMLADTLGAVLVMGIWWVRRKFGK